MSKDYIGLNLLIKVVDKKKYVCYKLHNLKEGRRKYGFFLIRRAKGNAGYGQEFCGKEDCTDYGGR